MRKITMLAVSGALALAAPAMAETPVTTSAVESAQRQCVKERTQLGPVLFGQTYGTNANRANAFGKCVSKHAGPTAEDQAEAKTNAAKDCKAERDADVAAFKAKYGTNANGANAFGKCVSGKAKLKSAAAATESIEATVNAARACKTERSADAAAFRTKYGTNANGRNAFGKCVSRAVAAQQQA